MSDEKPEGVKSTVGGWAKGIVTSIIGLASGAFLMYLTPVVNNAIKPAKPVANFATQVGGLTVNFNNRSTGGVQGWWDFGDGTALEPFDPNVENVKHVYAKAGTYNVKLTLANLLGEESDRTAPVSIDGNSPDLTGPAIELFDLKPIGTGETAPAVYRLTTKSKNATHCILSYGDTRPMKVLDAGVSQEQYLTFEEGGTFRVRLAAVNGKQLTEQTKTIKVGATDGNAIMAKLLVSYEAVQVVTHEKALHVRCDWQGDTKAAVSSFRKERPLDSGFKFVRAEIVNKDDKNPLMRNVKCEPNLEKDKIVVTGELVRPTGILTPKATAPHWVAEVKVTMERRSAPQSVVRDPIRMRVGLNTPTSIPVQPLDPGYEMVRKQVTLQIWDGKRKAWEGSNGVSNQPVTLNNQACMLTAQPQADGVVLTITPVLGPAIRPVGFDYLPKRPK